MGTATPSAKQNTSYTVQSAQHWGLQMETGFFEPSTSYTTGTGDLTTFGIGNPNFVFFTPVVTNPIHTAEWNTTGGGVMMFTSTALYVELAGSTLPQTTKFGYLALKWGSR